MTGTDLYNTLSEDRQDAEKPRCNGFRYYRPMRSSGSTTKLLFMFDGLHWKADTASMRPCRAFGCQALSYHWFHLAVADSLVSTLHFSITALAVLSMVDGLVACVPAACLPEVWARQQCIQNLFACLFCIRTAVRCTEPHFNTRENE